jgi:hypothetical protein
VDGQRERRKETEMSELDTLKEKLAEELFHEIADWAEEEGAVLKEVQPPESVIRLAAEAAANVIMAFERGYRMVS